MGTATRTLRTDRLEIPPSLGRIPPPGLGKGRILTSELTVSFGQGARGVIGLNRVSLDIAPGEFLAVLGPSGCGKSTLLNVLAGFEKASHGEAFIDGVPVPEPGPDRPVVFQHHSLFPWMTALENIEFGLKIQKKTDARGEARRFLGLVGLSEFESHYPSQLSGGMQQRVGLARALAVEPRILLMDEPFGSLDAQSRVLMQEQLLRLWDQRRPTVVFVTHDIDEAIFLADRVAVMGVKPNSLRGVFNVELPRPRNREVRAQEGYERLYQEIFGLIRRESLKTFTVLEEEA